MKLCCVCVLLRHTHIYLTSVYFYVYKLLSARVIYRFIIHFRFAAPRPPGWIARPANDTSTRPQQQKVHYNNICGSKHWKCVHDFIYQVAVYAMQIRLRHFSSIILQCDYIASRLRPNYY